MATGPIGCDPDAPFWDPTCGENPWSCVSYDYLAPPNVFGSWKYIDSYTASVRFRVGMHPSGSTTLFGELKYGYTTIGMSSYTYFNTSGAGGIEVRMKGVPYGSAVYDQSCWRPL